VSVEDLDQRTSDQQAAQAAFDGAEAQLTRLSLLAGANGCEEA
jgi:hypothetical protein